MTENNGFKKKIRARMEMTGETYGEAYEALYDAEKVGTQFFLNRGFQKGIPAGKKLHEVTLDDLFEDSELSELSEVKKLLCEDEAGLYVFAGLTGEGKTTLMNATLNSYLEMVPDAQVTTIEDALELRISDKYAVRSFQYIDDVWPAYRQAMNEPADMMTFEAIKNHNVAEYIDFSAKTQKTLVGSHSAKLVSLIDSLHYWGIDLGLLRVVMTQKRFTLKSKTLYLRSALVITDDIRSAGEKYLKDSDSAAFYRTLDSLGVKTLEHVRKKLIMESILRPALSYSELFRP